MELIGGILHVPKSTKDPYKGSTGSSIIGSEKVHSNSFTNSGHPTMLLVDNFV